MRIGVVGGGAAGVFTAVQVAQSTPAIDVVLFEASSKLLSKVLLSGGGRCNITHNSSDMREMAHRYPRGAKELIGPLTRFGPQQMIQWLHDEGVNTITEQDHRVFPHTHDAATVIECLIRGLRQGAITIHRNAPVSTITFQNGSFCIVTPKGKERVDRLVVATGGSPAGTQLASSLGHTIIDQLPSLFPLVVNDPRFQGLAGLTFPSVIIKDPSCKRKGGHIKGGMLVTHKGISGPAVLNLSCIMARQWAECNYRSTVQINFTPDISTSVLFERLIHWKQMNPSQNLRKPPWKIVPTRYWQRLLQLNAIEQQTTWASLSKRHIATLSKELSCAEFPVIGKDKGSMVSCGGVSRKEIDFRTMQSRLCQGLYVVGELLDIDGPTGGFNLQNAWTTGWVAAQNLVDQFDSAKRQDH